MAVAESCLSCIEVFFILLCPWVSRVCKRVGQKKTGTNQPKEYCIALLRSTLKAQGKEKEQGYLWLHYLSSQVMECMLRPCFPGSGWTSAWWWEAVNKFLILLWLCRRCTSLIKLSLFQPMGYFFFFCSSSSFNRPAGAGELSEQLGGYELWVRFNSPQVLAFIFVMIWISCSCIVFLLL